MQAGELSFHTAFRQGEEARGRPMTLVRTVTFIFLLHCKSYCKNHVTTVLK